MFSFFDTIDPIEARSSIEYICCNKIHSSGYVKCTLCGKAFKAIPLAMDGISEGNDSDLVPPAKRQREWHSDKTTWKECVVREDGKFISHDH